MDKKRALFLLQLFLILIFTINSSIAQDGKTTKSSSVGKKTISKTSNISSHHWNLIEINGLKVKNTKPFIEFNSTDKAFVGSGGCNRMFGKFEVKGSRIKFSGIGTTRMFCSAEGVMKLEGEFIKALEQVTRFEQKGDVLNLFAENNLILKFSRAAENTSGNENSNATISLEDKKWILASIAGKPLPKAEKTPFLIFNKKEANAGGDSGCNSYGGSYKIEGNKISITEIVSTLRACIEDERMNIERELLDGLKKTNRFEIKAGRLNLYEGDKLLLTFNRVTKN